MLVLNSPLLPPLDLETYSCTNLQECADLREDTDLYNLDFI